MDFNTIGMLDLLENLADGHVRYSIGPGVGKVSPLRRTEPENVRGLDCSGFSQYVIYRTSLHNVRIPQGSHRQETWFQDNDYTSINYSDEAYKLDNMVRIGFRARTHSLIRHVWLSINGQTYECTTRPLRKGPT